MKRFLGWTMTAAFLLAPMAGRAEEDVPKLFKAKCASCHAADGSGKTKQGEKLQVRDMASEDFQKGTDDQWKKSLTEGIKEKKKPAMKDKLSPEQIDLLIKYVRGLKK